MRINFENLIMNFAVVFVIVIVLFGVYRDSFVLEKGDFEGSDRANTTVIYKNIMPE